MTTFEVIQILILIATIGAIVVGPILAIQIARKRDIEREAKERKLRVFRDIMGTRGVLLDPAHVAALNVVEIDFYEDREVVSAYRSYMQKLNSAAPTDDQSTRFYDEKDDLFLDLVQSMGRHLGYQFDKRELQRTGYAPKGWFDDQNLQRDNAIRLASLLEGKRTLPISVRSEQE